jgi:menaquinone-9 beta-reductase
MATPEATIIGAGPAGSVAATMLARRGWHVRLVEQHRFPRDKVCGECLSATGADVLERLGLMEPVRALGAVPLHRAVLHARDGTAARLPLPRPMWGISRRTLDALLLDAARSAGAEVLQPARCETISAAAPRPRIRIRNLYDNSIVDIASHRILLADGKAALLPHRPAATGDFGIQAHFAELDGVDEGTIELFAVNGHYGGICRIEGGLWNAAFSVPARRLKQARDLDHLFRMMMRENPALARRMTGARRVRDWLATPLPRHGLPRNWPRGVIPLGNSAAAIEPIGGEGMGLAMRSAELAAEGLATGTSPSILQGRFRKLWRWRQLVCNHGPRLVARPAVLRLLAASAGLQRGVMTWMGKA